MLELLMYKVELLFPFSILLHLQRLVLGNC